MVWWRDDRGPFKVVSTIYKWHELMNSGGSRPSYKGGGQSSRPSDKGRGGGHPDPEMGGRRSQKNFFRPFGPQFGLKIRAPRTPPLDPPLMNTSGYEMI